MFAINRLKKENFYFLKVDGEKDCSTKCDSIFESFKDFILDINTEGFPCLLVMILLSIYDGDKWRNPR